MTYSPLIRYPKSSSQAGPATIPAGGRNPLPEPVCWTNTTQVGRANPWTCGNEWYPDTINNQPFVSVPVGLLNAHQGPFFHLLDPTFFWCRNRSWCKSLENDTRCPCHKKQLHWVNQNLKAQVGGHHWALGSDTGSKMNLRTKASSAPFEHLRSCWCLVML